jgi:hypothetical protein
MFGGSSIQWTVGTGTSEAAEAAEYEELEWDEAGVVRVKDDRPEDRGVAAQKGEEPAQAAHVDVKVDEQTNVAAVDGIEPEQDVPMQED